MIKAIVHFFHWVSSSFAYPTIYFLYISLLFVLCANLTVISLCFWNFSQSITDKMKTCFAHLAFNNRIAFRIRTTKAYLAIFLIFNILFIIYL